MKNVYQLWKWSNQQKEIFGQAFHAKCYGRGKTITIIKNNLNYVSGVFASSGWINDLNAFLFSLRRDAVSYKDKFTVKNAGYAIFGHASYGPTFGGGYDICDQPNTKIGSYSNFGNSKWKHIWCKCKRIFGWRLW